nr:hydroxyethylthiazole kinase [Legionella tunisiensis]
MINLLKDLEDAVVSLRQTKPLVLCLTNFVTMEFMANSLLALGAAPLMSQAMDEIEELVTISQVVNINLGTIDQAFYERAFEATKLAKIQKNLSYWIRLAPVQVVYVPVQRNPFFLMSILFAEMPVRSWL